ncbi:hypothetical protein ACFU98_43560 [Streptomyces sp. NPDC057575]|uniref:hypothetical protein n=1 Tax=unclassified Streptomyces TaxID=2593676 RepID=UPI0036C248A3
MAPAERVRNIPHTIPEKRDQAGHRRRRGSQGGKPPGFDREKYKARHVVENRIGLLKQGAVGWSRDQRGLV